MRGVSASFESDFVIAADSNSQKVAFAFPFALYSKQAYDKSCFRVG